MALADAGEKAGRVHDLFRQQETRLLEPLLGFIREHPGTRLIGSGSTDGRAPTVAFTVPGRSSMEIGSELGKRGLGVGAGHFYALRLIRALGIDTDDGWEDDSAVHRTEGVLRASFVHYTIFDSIDTRKRLVPACALLVFANAWEIVVFILAVITSQVLSPRILG